MIQTAKICRHIRQYCSKADQINNNEITSMFYNRNPRNLERLRIAYKPRGYGLEAPGREYWHRLSLEQKNRYVVASIVHNTGVIAVTASTAENAIRRHLYRPTDVSAYHNLGRVLAQRCLESGIAEIYSSLSPDQGEKVAAFVGALEAAGISLAEPKRFFAPRPWDMHRKEKPWEVTE
ncbi:39S ribosomal protein L18, mitochondrial [Schistocerca nitens]|uniref:39S ribosomal protein L18, mitochondrial n=1 Tax=Schistocerca nitens TaxID=7011 RepID=UPI002117E77B|nr:39S ribosomal protein L18, mitochondrial [Schistocerca nitens]XP_049851126.1 39S ribosomal protein L18, mitochondrial [Schistocerca gregaria]